MNFAFYIAKRYLFSKKSTNIINIISLISIIGIAIGTTAIITVLSVFNGFDDLIRSLFNTFDPDLKIELAQGKTFSPNTSKFIHLQNLPEIEQYVEILEENALLQYEDKQYIASVMGVGDNFSAMNGIDSMIVDGEFKLKHNQDRFAVVGRGVAYFLSIGIGFVSPIKIWVPKRHEKISLDPEKAFNYNYIHPSGIFYIQQEYDSKYIILPIDYTRKLLDYSNEVSSIAIKVKKGYGIADTKFEIKKLLGEQFTVKDRYEQHEFLFKIMKSEKWAIFLILSFVVLILSFNIIGSLTMLIIDKKKDIVILRNLGADDNLVKLIFLLEGWLISFIGVVCGLIFGLVISYLQQEFGFLQLHGNFIVNAYPVKIQLLDFIYVFFTVVAIGFFAAWYPVRFITKKYIQS